MGKTITILTIIIFIDLLLVTTGQICNAGVGCSLSSNIFNAILQIGDVQFSQLFTELIGSIISKFSSTTGILSLIATGAVIVGSFYATREFRILLIPMVFTLALVTGDLVFITQVLFSYNKVLATFIMAPLSIIYILTIIDWFKGSD